MPDRITTLHPGGKQGTTIDKDKYDVIRDAILVLLNEHGELAFGDLRAKAEERLGDTFDGSVSWYVTTVKLDLEARGEVERVPKQRPQRLRRTS